MIDADKCPECHKYWTMCPCCSEVFCHICGMTEDEAEVFSEMMDDEEDE